MLLQPPLLFILLFFCGLLRGSDFAHTPHWRKPVAIGLVNHGTQLAVANAQSGSISLIDIASRRVVTEQIVANSISDLFTLTLAPHEKEEEAWFVLDNSEDAVLHLRPGPDSFSIVHRFPVASDPVRMKLDSSGTLLAVASRWSRRVTVIPWDSNTDPGAKASHRELGVVDLPFAACMIERLSEPGRFVVSDAFGGEAAILDAAKKEVVSMLCFPANNIRGLTFQPVADGGVLWLGNESLNEKAATIGPDVTWGVLMDNHLRRIPLNELLQWSGEATRLGRVFRLGDELGPGGDPGPILITDLGEVLVLLSGVDRLGIKADSNVRHITRLPVGKHPVAMTLGPEQRYVYVANRMSDSVSVVNIKEQNTVDTISLGPQPEWTSVEKGERHFYDATLSLRGWFSCHSCHTDGHTSGLLNDNLGDEDFGAPKRIPTLLGVSGTEPLGWLANMETLEAQAEKSLTHTLINLDHDSHLALELAAYLRTLNPPPSLNQARGDAIDRKRLALGESVFKEQRCDKCHQPPTYTSGKVYDVGLSDEKGRHRFNPPSLRGISQRDAFFHDNRASSLKEVLVDHEHPYGKEIPSKEFDQLLGFLKSL